MALTQHDGGGIRGQLQKILASPGFARNERLSGFLQYVVTQELDGKADQIKESVIAVEVFGRKPDYDPRQDSVVRTEAAKLRARLAEYYAGPGTADSVVIEIPKGGYAPLVRLSGVEPRAASRWRRWWQAGIAAVLVVLSAGSILLVRHKPGPVQPQPGSYVIAVLPFKNLSSQPDSEYFSDGLTDEIIRNLCIIEGLQVRSQTSSFAFKDKPRNMREVGAQLGANLVVEGSVLRSGDQLRINAQLIRVSDDLALWSGSFDRELKDVFAIQDEISRSIVNQLRLQLGSGRRRYETSIEAYDLYLRARALLLQRGTPGYSQSIGPYEEAIAKDPSFAPAYAGLAAAYASRSGQFVFDIGGELAKARAAAEKAIQLDPLLAEAHYALGLAYARDGKWEQSEKSFRRAIELDPSRSMSHTGYATNLLLPLGRIAEALQRARVAEKMDPLSPWIRFVLAYVLLSAGRYDEAASHCQKLPADFAQKQICLGRARLGQGKIGEAVQILANDPGLPKNPQVRGLLGYAYAQAGRRDEAEKLATDVSANPVQQALVFAGLGDKDRTLEALDRMTALGPARLGRDLTFREFALLRGDPRLKALRKKAGLPE